MQHEWFENWFDSPYYHKLYFERDKQEANAFIEKLIQHLKPSVPSTMLDVACGKGRHSRQLASYGHDVTGIDLSEQSIQEALLSSTEKLNFYRHDMRLPFWIHYFDYAFNFFTSFGYFRTQRENDNAIRTIASSLKKNGIFVMDYLNTHFSEDQLIHKSEKTVDDVQFIITKWFDEDFFYKKIEVLDEQLTEPLVYNEKVAKFTLGDFTDMFGYQGLQIKEVYGDYDFNRYDVKKSSRLIMIAQKV